MDRQLSTDAVEEVFLSCMSSEHATGQNETVQGVVHKFSMDPEKVREHSEQIHGWLDQLPEAFHEGTGDGWSFLNACYDRDGRQWTGLHLQMEKLFVLGQILGRVTYPLPRTLWNVLPGGMPYVMIRKREADAILD